MRTAPMNPPPVTEPRKSLRDKIIVIVGGVFLLGLVLSAWFPPSCSLLKRHLIGCPAGYIEPILTTEQAELGRVGHQDITQDYSYFTTKSQEYRLETSVRFEYWGKMDKLYGYLQVKKGDAYQNISLISHPLLTTITWPSVGTPDFRLYQRTERYHSVNDMALPSGLPTPDKLVADSVAAAAYSLKPNQYTPLESLASLDGIDYVLTSYSPPYKDGSWLWFDRTFDLTSATPDKDGSLDFSIYIPGLNKAENQPFHLGTIHVDYHRITP